MRILKLSLIAVVIVSTLGLSWLFDQAYNQYSAPIPPPDAIDVFRQQGANLAQAANKSANSEEFLSFWPKTEQHSLILQQASESALPLSLLEKIKQGEPVLLETSNQLSYHYFLPAKQQILILKSPLINHNAHSSTNYLWTIAFYVILISILLLWAYPLVQQLLSLRLAAKAFGEGKLDKRITPNAISYIHDIEVEFNRMAKRIESLVDDVKLLSTAVSHDLRTPLARIQFGLDTLQEVDDTKLRKELEKQLDEDVEEMTSLVETLLNYARLDQNMLTIQKMPTDLSLIIQNCIKRKQADNLSIAFENNNSSHLILANEKYIHMVLNNLIQNAINYGDGEILIELNYDKDFAIVDISDDGNGIPIELRKDILKPFFRAKNHLENPTKTKGHGIGLAIVCRILDWHKGTLIISDANTLSGSKFTVKLPIDHLVSI